MRKAIPCAALALMLALSACGGGQPAAAPETAAAAPVTALETSAENTVPTETEPEPETETGAETEPVQEAETGTEEPSGFKVTKTVLCTCVFDKKYYLEDAVEVNEYSASYDTALVRGSTGVYHDSESEPGLFVPDEFTYSGETAGTGTVYQVKAGDVMGDLTVNSAETILSCYTNEESGEITSMPIGTDIKFDGEITLTGILRYYFDEQYMISSGDVRFIPDSSYSGLPAPFDISGGDAFYGTRDFDIKEPFDPDNGYGDPYWGGGVCVYSDAPAFRLGNVLYDLKDDTGLIGLLDGANADCSKRVEITLGDIELCWSEQFGTNQCSASIKNIKTV